MSGATPITAAARSISPRAAVRSLLTAIVCAVSVLALPTGAQAAPAGSWGWAQPSLRFAAEAKLLPPALTQRGPAAPVSRKAWVRSLAALEAYRAQAQGAAAPLGGMPAGVALADAPAATVYARSVSLGWSSSQAGRFAGSKPVTGDEAARGIVGALGLQASVAAFAERLKAEIPGARTDYYVRAAHVYTRVLNLRYNHLVGQEFLEVSPGEGMKVGHVAYMLDRAAHADSWRLNSLTAYETFDLPALGANQAQVLRSGVEMLGQPYVWAGETEGVQSEGHGGFDCSGFIWRTVLGGGVPADARRALPERTSMAMSDLPARARIGAAGLRPGDLMFWGYKGPGSRPADNFHAGVYMGNGWFIHSSGGNAGPNIDRLDGWWGERFSWGRRVLKRT